MTSREQMAERHVLEHEARLKHIDELMAKAEAAPGEAAEELAELKEERGKLAESLNEMRKHSEEEWAKKAGPMVMWEIVAEKLENLVQRLAR
jgi:chromosome segregation ATPase